jgi:hypothetical protein
MAVGLIALVFLAVTFLAALLFVGWVAMLIVQGLNFGARRVVSKITDAPRDVATWACPHFRCKQRNPLDARYCRRCGRSLRKSTTVLGQWEA